MDKCIPTIYNSIPSLKYSNAKTTGISVIAFFDTIQVILNETGTFGAILYLSIDDTEVIVESNILLGSRENEMLHLYGRILLRKLKEIGFKQKKLILFSSVKDHNSDHLRDITGHIGIELANMIQKVE